VKGLEPHVSTLHRFLHIMIRACHCLVREGGRHDLLAWEISFNVPNMRSGRSASTVGPLLLFREQTKNFISFATHVPSLRSEIAAQARMNDYVLLDRVLLCVQATYQAKPQPLAQRILQPQEPFRELRAEPENLGAEVFKRNAHVYSFISWGNTGR
jgi:hypothetical protein